MTKSPETRPASAMARGIANKPSTSCSKRYQQVTNISTKYKTYKPEELAPAPRRLLSRLRMASKVRCKRIIRPEDSQSSEFHNRKSLHGILASRREGECLPPGQFSFRLALPSLTARLRSPSSWQPQQRVDKCHGTRRPQSGHGPGRDQ